MNEFGEYLATVYIEDRCGDQVWVTEQICRNSHHGTHWIETELNARRQAVAPGAAQGWHYVATFDKLHPPPMVTAYLRGPDTPIEWVYSDIDPRRRAHPVTRATRPWGHR
jgi:hypothetical protein